MLVGLAAKQLQIGEVHGSRCTKMLEHSSAWAKLAIAEEKKHAECLARVALLTELAEIADVGTRAKALLFICANGVGEA